jgi:hypothetical protein
VDAQVRATTEGSLSPIAQEPTGRRTFGKPVTNFISRLSAEDALSGQVFVLYVSGHRRLGHDLPNSASRGIFVIRRSEYNSKVQKHPPMLTGAQHGSALREPQ